MATSMALNEIAVSSASSVASKMSSKPAMKKFVGFHTVALSTKNASFPSVKCAAKVNMAVAVDVSRFENVSMAPPDPILGVSEAFKADTDATKLNLGVGAYRTEDLQPYVLKVVNKAEQLMLERGENKEYLPIEGLAAFNKATAELLLGADNPVIKNGQIATVQGLSGTGSLRLGAAFIARYFPGVKVLISSPTWGNHKNILSDAGVPWSEYRYFDPQTVGLDFKGMIEDIKAAPNGSVILLHGCAHNPTGIDPTPEQWEAIADVLEEKGHMPFFDVAYQGFASGSLDDDASSVRKFASRGFEMFVAQSYSKNLGLYAERIGAINVILPTADLAARVKSQLKRLARPMYSNPPVHGARIVANVVGDSVLFDEWRAEMQMMAGRIKGVRQKLYEALLSKDKSGKDWSFILKQIGMFSFTGLTKSQSDNMTDKWHVYMTKDGRISLAGLNLAKCDYLADAIIDSYYNVK
ncbi:aspartate aminotransferase, chloroplastic [Selaginella moellendorffii]|nr:aspartate aminotransferase, chloroplastic [Selaginella moellendorffii]|eukprot:XP_002972976.2 aspartate aminotransferase, chloroplastic [Selaginella moellendorffii]